MDREFHILAGVVLVVLLSLFAASLVAASGPGVPPDSPKSPEVRTSNFFAGNGKLECGLESQTCGLAVECCKGLYCSERDVCERCSAAGEPCGASSGGRSCCPGSYCYLGTCEAQTLHFCFDSENGPDYYSSGSASGDYGGEYGTYSDYCSGEQTAVDYYCQVNNEYSPVLSTEIDCPAGCTEGACN